MRPVSGNRPFTIALALAAGLLASCATGPPRRDHTPAILEIRDDYLRANPEGRFNAEIMRGEIALGMGYHDVLAAWGLPDARWASPETDEERWAYVLVGDNGADWIRYDLLFAKRTVAEWETSRHVASAYSPASDDPRGVSLRVPGASSTTFGEGVRKGGPPPMMR